MTHIQFNSIWNRNISLIIESTKPTYCIEVVFTRIPHPRVPWMKWVLVSSSGGNKLCRFLLEFLVIIFFGFEIYFLIKYVLCLKIFVIFVIEFYVDKPTRNDRPQVQKYPPDNQIIIKANQCRHPYHRPPNPLRK